MPAAQTIAKFADLFSDATKDPLQGQYHELFATFDINDNNVQHGIAPSVLCDYILLRSAYLQMVSFILTFAQPGWIEP